MWAALVTFLTWEVDNAWKDGYFHIADHPPQPLVRVRAVTFVLNRYNNLVAEALMADPLIGLSSLSMSGF